MVNQTARPRYRFGELVLSPGQRLLLRGGEPVALPPRYLDLLLLLIGERHRVVEREEIHQLVWGGVAVTDGAFTQAVRTVRRALGDDDPREPRFIRTAARHGYQFVFAPVVEEDDAAPLDAAPLNSAATDVVTAAAVSPSTVAELAAAGEAFRVEATEPSSSTARSESSMRRRWTVQAAARAAGPAAKGATRRVPLHPQVLPPRMPRQAR